MNKSLKLFAQLTKIDESRHEVWGIATAEVVDKEGEIFDYASSKPYFEAWSSEIAKATDGKSLGNVREMHAPNAVGKLVSIEFDDELKQINIGAKIVDEGAWQKCAQGVYTGFSIGGTYVKAWEDGEFVRFTANPAEISVVDNPCVPSAHFTAVKTDGTCELRKFKEAISTQQSAFSPGTSSRVCKIGARHSRETLEHLHAIQKCLDAAAESHQEAAAHMDALLEGGRDDNASTAPEDGDDSRKIAGAQRSQIKTAQATVPVPHRTGEHTNMLDTQDKDQLEKAHAYSTSALSKVAEVERSVAKLRDEMETNNEQVQKSLQNLVALIEKLVDPQPAAGKVARTAVPAITVRKEDDGAGAEKNNGEKSVHDLMKQALQNPQHSSSYLR
ncbi:MAG TPA: hypothetical protein VJ723_04010 [Candidatus Angelobacter sp.]|nr:hypothetical protein [Candidatus Angelobacter sp.]